MLKKKLLARSREVTMPDERYRSIVYAEHLLVELCKPGNRVPRIYKDRARAALRHFPTQWDLKQLESAAPHVIQAEMEPLYRMILQQEENKNT